MAITDKKTGVWGLDQVYNKENQGAIWTYSGASYLFAVGNNADGQLGLHYTVVRSSPLKIPGTWDGAVTAGQYTFLASKSDGTLWTCGHNSGWSVGTLGLNNQTSYSSPPQIPGTTWSKMCKGKLKNYFVAIKTDGTLWTMGRGNNGVLGQNNTTSYSSPVQIPGTDYVTTHGKWIADGSRATHLSVLKNP